MPRFKSRVDGYMRRKPHWVCKQCGVTHTVSKPSSCTACGTGREFVYFPSAKEYRRYRDLLTLRLAGKVTEIELQPAYVLHVGDQTFKCSFDFRYRDLETGEYVIEDVKTSGTNTDLSRLKRALAEVEYDIKVVLIQ